MTDVVDNQLLIDAVEVARAALVEDGQRPGAYRQAVVEGEWAAAHYFDAEVPGYRGWQWCVVVAGSPGSTEVTVSEVVLLPSDGALLSPAWVPWSRRVAAGDLGPGDELASDLDDPRLVPNQINTADEFVEPGSDPLDPDDVGQVVGELGLGRKRLLSSEGRDEAAQRWYDGEYGPSSEMARSTSFACCSCGFYIPLSGALRSAFGACANEFAADAHVVSSEYGCGAHSDMAQPKGEGSPAFDAFDDGVLEIVAVGSGAVGSSAVGSGAVGSSAVGSSATDSITADSGTRS